MKINEKIKKCVAFLQYQMANGDYIYAGTGFFIVRDQHSNNYRYIVTAKHVIEGIKKMGIQHVFARMNTTTSTIIRRTVISEWFCHNDTNVDIAICPFYFQNDVDHMYYPESSFLDDKKLKLNELDCGDEVFITGLFKHHSGQKRNIPVVRIGNISMMPEEKIRTKDHLMDAYLIESRSIGGLSGSPVFVNYGVVRKLEGQVKHSMGDDIHNLLGLVYGHFDSDPGEVDGLNVSTENNHINVGMAIVTPISKLVEMFDLERIKNHESEIDKLLGYTS